MNIRDIVEALPIDVLTGEDLLDRSVAGGYVADLLSCVMAGASADDVWITLQTHANIIAVASLLGIAAIIVAEGAPVPQETLRKAQSQDMIVLSTPEPIYKTVARLVELGV
ncbi:MAG: DRTGG domain-containing protein [Anaerolineales bacterium]